LLSRRLQRPEIAFTLRTAAHSPPGVELSHRVLSTLLSKEGIYGRLRYAPVATVQLVGALEAAALAPAADGRRRAVELHGEVGYREVRRRGRLLGLAIVTRRELEEPVASERQRASRWQALGEVA